jgi:DNA-binding NtrC family response regulator
MILFFRFILTSTGFFAAVAWAGVTPHAAMRTPLSEHLLFSLDSVTPQWQQALHDLGLWAVTQTDPRFKKWTAYTLIDPRKPNPATFQMCSPFIQAMIYPTTMNAIDPKDIAALPHLAPAQRDLLLERLNQAHLKAGDDLSYLLLNMTQTLGALEQEAPTMSPHEIKELLGPLASNGQFIHRIIDSGLYPDNSSTINSASQRVTTAVNALFETLNEANVRFATDAAASMIGESPATLRLRHFVVGLAGRRESVIITGPSGSGKEVLAKALHHSDRERSHRPFVSINLGAIPHDLAESILFGHKKGAFTGAHKDAIGVFEQARNGTLFLDEIGDLPYNLQVKLLHVLQSKSVVQVGGVAIELGDAFPRIIAATNKNLKDLMASGKFREDLYYRLSVIAVDLPPLKDRVEDIIPLAHYFLDKYGQGELFVKVLSVAAEKVLTNYPWPGNIRELENVIQAALAYAQSTYTIDPEHLHILSASTVPGRDPSKTHPELPLLKDLLTDFSRKIIEDTLAICHGYNQNAASILGMSPTYFRTRARRLGITLKRQVSRRPPQVSIEHRVSFDDQLKKHKCEVILSALNSVSGNVKQASLKLGITSQTLTNHIQSCG